MIMYYLSSLSIIFILFQTTENYVVSCIPLHVALNIRIFGDKDVLVIDRHHLWICKSQKFQNWKSIILYAFARSTHILESHCTIVRARWRPSQWFPPHTFVVGRIFMFVDAVMRLLYRLEIRVSWTTSACTGRRWWQPSLLFGTWRKILDNVGVNIFFAQRLIRTFGEFVARATAFVQSLGDFAKDQ